MTGDVREQRLPNHPLPQQFLRARHFGTSTAIVGDPQRVARPGRIKSTFAPRVRHDENTCGKRLKNERASPLPRYHIRASGRTFPCVETAQSSVRNGGAGNPSLL